MILISRVFYLICLNLRGHWSFKSRFFSWARRTDPGIMIKWISLNSYFSLTKIVGWSDFIIKYRHFKISSIKFQEMEARKRQITIKIRTQTEQGSSAELNLNWSNEPRLSYLLLTQLLYSSQSQMSQTRRS